MKKSVKKKRSFKLKKFVIACVLLIIFLILLILFYKRFFLSADIHKDTRIYPLVLEFYESMDEPCYKARNNTCVKVTKKDDEYTQHVIDTKKLKLLKNYECKSNYCYYFDKNNLSGIIDDSRFLDVSKYNKEIRFGNEYYLKEILLDNKTLYYAEDWPPMHVVLNDKLEVLSAGVEGANVYFNEKEGLFGTFHQAYNEIKIYNADGKLQRTISSDVVIDLIENYYLTLEDNKVVLYNYSGEKLLVLCELQENYGVRYRPEDGRLFYELDDGYLYFYITNEDYIYQKTGSIDDATYIHYKYDIRNNKIVEIKERHYDKDGILE